MATNGNFGDFNIIKSVNLSSVRISTDAVTKKVYDTIRIGGDFDLMISNVKNFVALKKEKPYLSVSTEFTVNSDNFHEIPAAVKMYEDLGTQVRFHMVLRDKDDPLNIGYRVDLYEKLVMYLDKGIAAAQGQVTKNDLDSMKKIILDRYQQQKTGQFSLVKKFWGIFRKDLK